MFNLKAHENDIINFRSSDLSKLGAKVLENLLTNGLGYYPSANSRIEKQLEKLTAIRENAKSRNEDYADYYEGELFKFVSAIVNSGVAGEKPEATKEEEKQTTPSKSKRRLNWNGDIVVDGKIIEDTTDEDLQMESNYKGHATKEGFGQIAEHKKPSEICKEAGLSGLEELAALSEQSIQTLNNWSKNPKKQKLFNLLVLGATKQRHM